MIFLNGYGHFASLAHLFSRANVQFRGSGGKLVADNVALFSMNCDKNCKTPYADVDSIHSGAAGEFPMLLAAKAPD